MMTNIKKHIAKRAVLCGIAATVALAGCSDWTDHYDANTQLLDTQQQTLWQNIQQDNNLSEFASLLRYSVRSR